MTRNPRGSFWSLTLLSVLLGSFFFIPAGPFLRVFHNVHRSSVYWGTGLFASGLLVSSRFWSPVDFTLTGFLLLSIWVVVGIYGELERRGQASFTAGLASLLAGMVIVSLGPQLFYHFFFQTDFFHELGLAIDQALSLSTSLAGGKGEGLIIGTGAGDGSGDGGSSFLRGSLLLSQLPSIFLILEMSVLGGALMFSQKLGRTLGLSTTKVVSEMRLLEFRVPDGWIWITALSFLVGYVKISHPWMRSWFSLLGLNVFHALMGFYFFQGLAILEVFFRVFRTGSLVRILIYLLLVGQLFFLLCLVGLVDFWLDFRRRIYRMRFPSIKT